MADDGDRAADLAEAQRADAIARIRAMVRPPAPKPAEEKPHA
ncbi:hypothetical protein C8P66_108136 [Humitalea rosea]|uniref:Uncharacterized protein n=1 Tax=Humitalea rosea TaxID=990373 RepID=A0A2W7ILG6_9PROT|nr:hypothetical protein [Humitalea rosea]PZW46857.1 hypothetical protein C8P66_108136 [Humitalea rosea]